MPKIRIFTKSGNQIDLDVEEFRVERNTVNDSYIKWEATWKDGKYPRIISMSPSNIEAVIQLEK